MFLDFSSAIEFFQAWKTIYLCWRSQLSCSWLLWAWTCYVVTCIRLWNTLDLFPREAFEFDSTTSRYSSAWYNVLSQYPWMLQSPSHIHNPVKTSPILWVILRLKPISRPLQISLAPWDDNLWVWGSSYSLTKRITDLKYYKNLTRGFLKKSNNFM